MGRRRKPGTVSSAPSPRSPRSGEGGAALLFMIITKRGSGPGEKFHLSPGNANSSIYLPSSGTRGTGGWVTHSSLSRPWFQA